MAEMPMSCWLWAIVQKSQMVVAKVETMSAARMAVETDLSWTE